ncbi:MAG TPA: hypothetical protein DD414_08440 [Lachnospiraceae bacterium]|nr:hypothetical protein [Lachnospiraceae bacterium]
MKKDIDVILKQALSPKEEPGPRLNRKILDQAEERIYMGKKKIKGMQAAALAACITLAVGSMTVFAAWKYLSPAQVAQHFEDKKLEEAFQGPDAVIVNESQEYGDYKITLLGAVAGKNISEYLSEDGQGNLKEDMLYAAVAIERADGTPMPATDDDAYGDPAFYVSPYIRGLNPVFYSMQGMGGGYSEFVKDGVSYRLLEMDNIEIFADRGIYIGANEGSFYDNDAYHFDEATGEISRNDAYDGVNALFTLPLDASAADPATAEAYLKELEKDWETPDEPEEELNSPEIEAWIQMVDEAMENGHKLEEYADRVESTVKVLKPDAKGEMEYSWEIPGGSSSGVGTGYMELLFPEDKRTPGTLVIDGYSYSDDLLEKLEIQTWTLNDDGTVTAAIYVPKKG